MPYAVTGRRVVVLAGGLSPERDVSQRSGARVASALGDTGCDVTVRDYDATLLEWLEAERPDCAVPMLHGELGEGGTLQEVLELAGIPFVGSPAGPARVAFNKPVAKQVITGLGLRTPASVTLPADVFRELGATRVLGALVRRLGLPLVVKPAAGGSSLGCTEVHTASGLSDAIATCFGYGSVALVERFVAGVEVAVPVVELAAGPTALSPVEVCPDDGVYDYTARYTAGATEFVVPARLPPSQAADCAAAAVACHRGLGLRDLSRADLIIDRSGDVWFLEATVSPGMTETSLVPLALHHDDHALGRLLAGLVERALLRAGREVSPGSGAGLP